MESVSKNHILAVASISQLDSDEIYKEIKYDWDNQKVNYLELAVWFITNYN